MDPAQEASPRGTSGKPLHPLGPRLPVSAASLRCDSAAPRRVGDPQGASGGGSCLLPCSPTAATWECGPELPDLPKFQQEPKIWILKCKRSQFLNVGSNVFFKKKKKLKPSRRPNTTCWQARFSSGGQFAVAGLVHLHWRTAGGLRPCPGHAKKCGVRLGERTGHLLVHSSILLNSQGEGYSWPCMRTAASQGLRSSPQLAEGPWARTRPAPVHQCSACCSN